MKRVKVLACTLATFAMVMCTYIPAQAEFKGTLQGVLPWALEIDNSANTEPTAVTIFYFGRNLDFVIHTVPAGGSDSLTDLKIPKGTRRIIIEVNPGNGFFAPIRVIQGGSAFASPVLGDVRLVFDVV